MKKVFFGARLSSDHSPHKEPQTEKGLQLVYLFQALTQFLNGFEHFTTNLLVCKLSPYKEGKARPKKEAGHSRLVGGSIDKPGSLQMRLVLGNKTSRSLCLPVRSLEVYIEAFSHLHHPDVLNDILLSQARVLKNGYTVGKVDRTYIPETGEGNEEPSIAQVRLVGQPAVTASLSPPPTITLSVC